MRWDRDPTVQRVHEENTERMLLASFVGGMTGEIDKHTRVQKPQNLDQALNSALAIREDIRQERHTETFYTRSEKPVKLSGSKGKTGYRIQRENKPKGFRENKYARSPERAEYYKGNRDTQNNKEARRYECEGRGHFAYECPTGIKRTQTRNSPGRKHPSGRSSRPSSPRDEFRENGERCVHKSSPSSGNE
jgi:hypothetical protein